jgi:AraC-like DNA-binding protein
MTKYNITTKKEKEATYRSLVSPDLMDKLQEKILDIVVIQKKYRDKNYSAKRLAMDLGTNTRYISAVVNVRFHMNYTSFINKYRIEEAMSLLVDKRYQKLNMEEISDMVGFANRQSFYASFYKLKGITPREYRVEHLAQHPAEKVEKPKKKKSKAKAKAKATKKTTKAKAATKAKTTSKAKAAPKKTSKAKTGKYRTAAPK